MRLLALAVVLLATPVSAEQLTLDCRLSSTTNQYSPLDRVDQVVVNTTAPSVDFRVASTIGTTHPQDTHFGNEGGGNWMRLDLVSGVWSGAGASGIQTFALNYGYGILVFAEAGLPPGLAFSWNCEE